MPWPQGDNLRNNPCFKATNLTNKYLEVMAESESGATICVAESSGQTVADCAAGTLRSCKMAPANDLNFEFFCADSCQEGDVTFMYRFVQSEKNPKDDNWCDNRQARYPSDLMKV